MPLFKTFFLLLSTLFFVFVSTNENIVIGQTISTMSYNIRYNNPDDGNNWWNLRKQELIELIQYYHPDILGIQEGLHDQVEYIDQHMEHYSYIGVGRDDGQTQGEYTAIYYDSTKFDIQYQNTFWLSKTPEKVSVGWDASMERICTYGHFIHKSTQTEYHIFNAHFDHIGPKARENSAKLIVQEISRLKLAAKNIILMGDLNCLPNSQPILEFKKELDDASELADDDIYGPFGTFSKFDPSFIPDRRIDYIFSKNLAVLKYRHVDDRRANNLWPSDHLPVMASFDLLTK